MRLSPIILKAKAYMKRSYVQSRYLPSRHFTYPRTRFHLHFAPDTIAEMPRRGASREKTTVF